MTRYYYAGGQRIALEADDAHVAVDERRASAAGLGGPTGDEAARRLPGGVVLAERARVDGERLAGLRKAGALRPVFRHGHNLMVALPEIRVEVDNARQRKAVHDALSGVPHAVVVSSESAETLVLSPTSGASDDALDVANYLYEHAKPAASSVRFVQVMPRPGVQR